MLKTMKLQLIIISAVKTLRKEVDDHDNSQKYKPFCTKLLETKKVSLHVCKVPTRIKGEVPNNKQIKWVLDCNSAQEMKISTGAQHTF